MPISTDEFNDNTISGSWTQNFQPTGSGIEYTIASGTYAGQGFMRLYSADGPCLASGNGVYQSTSGDFDVDIKVSFGSDLVEDNTVTVLFETFYGGGMMAYIDADNYMAILRHGAGFVYKSKWDYDGGSGGSIRTSYGYYGLPPYYMRIKRVGNVFTPYYSSAAGKWYQGRDVTMTSGTCNVWLIANNDPDFGQYWIDIDYYRAT